MKGYSAWNWGLARLHRTARATFRPCWGRQPFYSHSFVSHQTSFFVFFMSAFVFHARASVYLLEGPFQFSFTHIRVCVHTLVLSLPTTVSLESDDPLMVILRNHPTLNSSLTRWRRPYLRYFRVHINHASSILRSPISHICPMHHFSRLPKNWCYVWNTCQPKLETDFGQKFLFKQNE